MITNCSITKEITGTGTYADGDCVGGLIEVDLPSSTGKLSRFYLTNYDSIVESFRVYVFNSNPSNSTLSDNAALSIAAADAIKLLLSETNNSTIDTAAATVEVFNAHQANNPIELPFSSANSKLYFAIANVAGVPVVLTENLQLKVLLTE